MQILGWRKARKKPIIVEFREAHPDEYVASLGMCEAIDTREGWLWAKCGEDYVIKGVDDELYPIKKSIFEKTYDVVEYNE